ncbi:MAG: Gfo/Idh/MocA family oxidoreductase [Bryobacteraceae bacterium]|nr:Gfo/Idh/MocA family oxidoreductase [Bryobacteraceae bacterium]
MSTKIARRAALRGIRKAKKYKDYRKMFEGEGRNLDAVMIATPDRMHTPIALLAMQQGKHVYCEKPLTRTAWESQLLADAAAKYKVATQMGNQGWNHEGTRTACEILWSGDIGEVKELHSWTGGIYGGQPNLPATGPEAAAVPGSLDWDLWLGCAEPRKFNPLMTNQWRAFIDFSTGGSLGDWLVHNLGPAHLALQLDKVSPTSVECVFVEGKNQWLWPLRAHVVFEFPARGSMPPVTVHTYQNMRGDFQNPAGMGENDRLFPSMNSSHREAGSSHTPSPREVVAIWPFEPTKTAPLPGARIFGSGEAPGGTALSQIRHLRLGLVTRVTDGISFCPS